MVVNMMSQKVNSVTEKCPPSELLNAKQLEFIHFINFKPSELKPSVEVSGLKVTGTAY